MEHTRSRMLSRCSFLAKPGHFRTAVRAADRVFEHAWSHLIRFCAVGALACSFDAAAQTEPRTLRPNTTFEIDIPNFGLAAHGVEGKVGIYLPRDYTVDRTFPLLVWFGGGHGGHSPGTPSRIVGGVGFICVALPYRQPSGGGEGGWAVTYWKDYKSMLDLVEAAVPNIDPENRIVGGYSSGGAAILELVARNKGDFQSYFHGFIPGGAGATAANAGSLRGRPVLFYCGDKDSRYPAMQSFYNAYSAAGVKAEFLTFKDIAHALPDSYFPEIRAWIMNKVVLRNLGDRVKQMNDRASSNQWIEALSLSASIRNLTAVDSPEYAAAESIRIRAETWGRQEATKWQAVGRSGPERRAFARNWRAYDFTAPLIRLCEEEGERELTALLDRNPTPPAALHRFLQDYNGFEVYRRGAMEFNVLGEKVLDGMLARSDVPPAQLAAFLQHWEGHPVEKKALEALNLQARFAHERFNRLPNPDVRQMREFIRVWSPSSYADEVKELLEQRAEEELKNILTIDNARMRAMRFQNFLRDFEGTEAARKASARK